LTKNVANKKGTTGVTRFQKDKRNACPSYYKSCPKVPGTFGQLFLVWGRKGSLWYNKKNIIGFGVGFLKW